MSNIVFQTNLIHDPYYYWYHFCYVSYNKCVYNFLLISSSMTKQLLFENSKKLILCAFSIGSVKCSLLLFKFLFFMFSWHFSTFIIFFSTLPIDANSHLWEKSKGLSYSADIHMFSCFVSSLSFYFSWETNLYFFFFGTCRIDWSCTLSTW